MCRFLTGKSRLQQTNRKRVWRLLDNEVFKADDGRIYIAPRNMLTDNYTIPLWVSAIAGSPVDYDTRAAHVHDQICYSHEALMTTLKEHELIEKGFLKYSDKNKMWVCEDIPVEFLTKRKVGKIEANNILYECMVATGIPLINRLIIRLGTIFNVGWHLDILTKKVFVLELDKVYKESYWNEHVPRK
jgi:hypothetical protein